MTGFPGVGSGGYRAHEAAEGAVEMVSSTRHSPVRPAGDGEGAWMAALEQGAHLLREVTPLREFDAYV